jgi:drug/metabolite transporter (DMT)-like permease
LIEGMRLTQGKGIRDAIPVAGLLLLCLLWSLDSLRSEFAPSATAMQLPPFARSGLHLALLGVASALLAVFRRSVWPRGRQILDAALIGLGLFGAPTVLANLSSSTIPDLSRVALFSLAPVFAVALEPYLGRLTEAQSKAGLLAALGCVIGTLGVFPLSIPRTLGAAGGFLAVILSVACVAAANCWAVRLVSNLPKGSGATVAAIAGATSAGALLICSGLSEGAWSNRALEPELVWSLEVELPALLLLFWLMRRMSAVRMTTRFVVTPLLVNVVVLILLRPAVNLRSALGLLLIAISAGWLLSAREEETESGTLPLNLNQN